MPYKDLCQFPAVFVPFMAIVYVLGGLVVSSAFTGQAATGGPDHLEGVFLFSNVANGLMALPNLIGLLLLSGIVLRETRSYLNGSSTSRAR